MKLKLQRRLAAQILKASPKRIRFDTENLDEIKQAITKADVRGLINDRIITKINKRGVSRARVSDRKSGPGSRKGKQTARLPKKIFWMNQIRAQREFMTELRVKGLITKKTFRAIYAKAKGGFFRSKRHIKIYLDENKLFVKRS
ncbi:50S ribosomal protein L19e [Candidatus Woesearchaeota archaeon]|nr:50S ribosomal protein L19e [Candidatus Woesearchaeota archaeon]